MTVRRLLYTMIALFGLLSLGAGLWQLMDSRNKLTAVGWIHSAGHLVEVAQRTAARMAMERGYTASLLADPARAEPLALSELQRLRASLDGLYGQLRDAGVQLGSHASAHPLFPALDRIEARRTTLVDLRTRADARIRGEPDGLSEAVWMDVLNTRIAELQDLAALSMLPLSDNLYTYASLPVIKDVLFTFSEHLGRERAMVGVAIARGRPIGDEEQRLLDDYRTLVTNARHRTEAILEHLPHTPDLDRAREVYLRDLHRYELLRAGVYAASREGRAYALDAGQWYREATTGIDAVLGLAAAIGGQFEQDVDRLRGHAVQTLALLALILVLLLFLFIASVQILRYRVLFPLQVFERSADSISRGDLTHPLPPLRDDEFGRVGKAFEYMRSTLLADLQQRDADAAELKKFRALIQHSASAMIVTDANGIIEYANEGFTTVTGYTQGEALGLKAGFWRSGRTSLEQYRQMWETVLHGKVWEGELINRRKNGQLYWASISLSPVFDEQGRVTHIIGAQNDISERKRVEERLNYLSSYDELTQLPNRSLLMQRFEHAAMEAGRSGTAIAIVSLGIGRFKRINDSLGRSVGDELLREVARRLTECARAHDTVSRHAGTEFTMMLTQLPAACEVGELLERIIETANLPLVIKGEKLQPVVCAGVSLLPQDGDSFDVLLRKAGMALHDAERHERRLCLYSAALDQDAQDRMSLENALRLSLERGELELHYQPKVDLHKGRMMGMEALARWRHPVHNEYISPERFIPIAEECGLIPFLGAWALREACRQNRAWQEAGLPSMIVAVNLSAAQLRQPGLVDLVVEVLRDSGLDPGLLELELTESALMEDPEAANLVLAQLKGEGVRLAIDDFGTGYSSLSYLSQFPVDQLKIDRSFVKEIVSDPDSAAISTSIIALAHQLGLEVIAEGVETEEQLAFLVRHGCDAIQGYYYSRPLPADRMTGFLGEMRMLVMPRSDPGVRTLLVADEDPEILAAMAGVLEAEAIKVLTACSGQEALELLARNEVQVLLAGEQLQEMDGVSLLARARSLYPELVRIMLISESGFAPLVEMVNAVAVYKVLPRSWSAERLVTEIVDAFEHHEKRNLSGSTTVI